MGHTGRILSFRDLTVWQKSISLVISVYKITKKFPASEQFALTSQIQRAAVSVPANIAEGYGRNTRKEYINFLRIATGSLAELESLFVVAKELAYCGEVQYLELLGQIEEISRMLRSLRSKLADALPHPPNA